MSRRERLQQARLAEARVLYLQARCNAGITGLRMRLRRHRTGWLLGGGFGMGVVVALVPVRALLRFAGSAIRTVGLLRVPLGALVVASGLAHERARTHTEAGPEDA
jgi:hypothetical protein